MNKMMKTLAVAAVAVGIAGAASAFDKGCETLDECKANAEEAFAVAETNIWIGTRMLGCVVRNLRAHYNAATNKETIKAYCAEIDGRIADVSGRERRTSVGDWRRIYVDDLFPKMCRSEFDKGFYKEGDRESVCPVLFSQAREKGLVVSPDVAASAASVDELVDLFNEGLALLDGKVRPPYCGYPEIKRFSRTLQTKTQRKARAYLRKQGKSFVSKDGANPCEAVMTELVAALNAPYLKGVNEWLEKVGATDRRIDVSKLPTEAEVAQLKEDILNGDKDMNRDYEFILKVCLGVEGYNSFVKEYNGDK